jgi:hypothetical protein
MGRHRSVSAGLGIVKALFSIIVLSAFVLGISFFVKGLNQLDKDKLVAYVTPVLHTIPLNKISNTKAGQVAGDMISKISNANLGGGGSTIKVDQPVAADTAPDLISTNPTFSLGLLADSHGNYANLGKALGMVKASNIDTVFFLGDFTELGLLEDLQAAKKVMDDSNLTYYAIAGDHDLWKSVGFENFLAVFKQNYYVKTIDGG